VVTVANSADRAGPKRNLLAFHVAQRRIDAERGQQRVAVRLGPVADRHTGPGTARHGGEHRPALPLVADHAAEHRGQAGAEDKDGDHLDQVGERRRVLERVRRVGVEEAAAVGAQHLDCLLRGDRAEREGLLGAFQRGRIDIGTQRLRHALPDVDQGDDDRHRQQHVESDADQIGPVVADGAGRTPGEARTKAMAMAMPAAAEAKFCTVSPAICEKIRHRRLAAVALPVGVGQEADRGVERQVGRQSGLAGRVEGKPVLQPQQRVEQNKTGRLEGQHADGVADPALFAVGSTPASR